jgi:hypothetical protein
MEFMITRYDGNISLSLGEGVLTGPPMNYDPEGGMFGKLVPSHLKVDETQTVFSQLFVTEQHYDGTLMFSQMAVCAVTTAAESYIAENPGNWVTSKVHCSSKMTRADMSYGKDVQVVHEITYIAITNLGDPACKDEVIPDHISSEAVKSTPDLSMANLIEA